MTLMLFDKVLKQEIPPIRAITKVDMRIIFVLASPIPTL
jgi:hypothetical protein